MSGDEIDNELRRQVAEEIRRHIRVVPWDGPVRWLILAFLIIAGLTMLINLAIVIGYGI